MKRILSWCQAMLPVVARLVDCRVPVGKESKQNIKIVVLILKNHVKAGHKVLKDKY